MVEGTVDMLAVGDPCEDSGTKTVMVSDAERVVKKALCVEVNANVLAIADVEAVLVVTEVIKDIGIPDEVVLGDGAPGDVIRGFVVPNEVV